MAARAGATAGRYGVRAVPSDRAGDRARSDAARHRSGARRGRDARQRSRRALHARRRIPMPSSRRATSSRARSSSSCSAGAPSDSTRAPRSATRFRKSFRPSSASAWRPASIRACRTSRSRRPRTTTWAASPSTSGGARRSHGLWACGETERDRRARRQSPGEQLAARSARLRLARRRPTSPVRANANRVRHRRAARAASMRRAARDEAQAISDLRNVMYANVGLVRNERGLREALARIGELERPCPATRRTSCATCSSSAASSPKPRSRAAKAAAATTAPTIPQPDEALAKRSFTRLRSVA